VTPIPPTATAEPFTLTSPAFADAAKIPEKYVCHGDNVSPPLAWSGVPGGTQSLALTVDDPDAASVVGYVWDHWVIYNLPTASLGLPEKVADKATLPDGSLQGTNSFGHTNYGGPCPPGSAPHHYVFTLYALDGALGLKPGLTKADLLKATEGHVLGQAQLTGQYP
jgi:Raf kinase inhibitor-like YbhB/YbcL family protein